MHRIPIGNIGLDNLNGKIPISPEDIFLAVEAIMDALPFFSGNPTEAYDQIE